MDWDTDLLGNPAIYPLVSYETGVVPKANCGLRLVLARADDPPGSGSMVVQMKMTISQTEAFIKDLKKLVAETLLTRSLTHTPIPEKPPLAEMAKGALTSQADLDSSEYQEGD
jgi:hypothetical protein